MRILVVAVGKATTGPERDLVDRYLDRAERTGRALKLAPVNLIELAEGRASRMEQRRTEEAEAIRRVLPAGTVLVALDEHGENLSSPAFTNRILRLRDENTSTLAFAIGGPDGHDPLLLAEARFRLAFGAATFPHLLARVMLTEQIYRATTILSGHPYHRV